MSLENLIGRECMVQALASATNLTPSQAVLEARSAQLESNKHQGLDRQREANSLEALLDLSGEKCKVMVQTVGSIAELAELLDHNHNNHIFVGFAAGPDGDPPHIAHLQKQVTGGFKSNQQFTPNEALITQLLEQRQLTVFVASQSV